MTSALDGLAQSGIESRPHVVRRLLSNPLAIVAIVILAVVAVLTAIGPAIAPYAVNYADVRAPLAPMSAEHLLGTDSSGRDVLSRLLHATQLTVLSAIVCAVVAIGLAACGSGSGPAARFDPDRLPEEELIRLATGSLVRLLPGLPRPTARRGGPRRRRRDAPRQSRRSAPVRARPAGDAR